MKVINALARAAYHSKLRFSIIKDVVINSIENMTNAIKLIDIFHPLCVPIVVTFNASTEYVSGRTYERIRIGKGMDSTGMKTPHRNIIGNLK